MLEELPELRKQALGIVCANPEPEIPYKLWLMAEKLPSEKGRGHEIDRMPGGVPGIPEGGFQFSKGLDLVAGDRVIFHTDGLVESLVDSRTQSFEVFRNFLAARPAQPVKEACHDVIRAHPIVVSGKKLPDDFTVVNLEKADGS